MRAAIVLCLILAAITLPFFGKAQSAGDYRSNAVTGNWSTSATWQVYNGTTWAGASNYPGQAAGAGTVTIRDGHTITLDVGPANPIGALTVGEGASGAITPSNTNLTLTVTNGLTVVANSSFNLRRVTLIVNGTSSISGAITDNSDMGAATFTGLVTINSNGSISTTNASDFTFKGGITNNGTLDLTGANAVAFTTNSQSIGGTATITMNGTVTVTGVTVTNNNPDLNLTGTAAGTLTGTGTWQQGTNAVLKYSGSTITISAVNFSANVNTVNYTLAGAQTVFSTTYQNLSISTSGIKTLGGVVTVSKNLDISGTATLASDIYQITGNATGTFTMASGTTLSLGKTNNAANTLFPTSFTNANIILTSGSTVTYQNNSTQTVSSTPTYANLTIATGNIKTIDGNTTVAGNLSVSAGTLDLGTTATTLTVNGTAAIAGTLSFNGTTTKTVTITGNLSGAGTINISGGSLLHNLNLGGATNAITTFTTAAVASTVTYTASGAQQVFGSLNYRNLTTSGSGTKSMGGAVTVAGTFTIGSGTSFDPVGQSITVNGSSVFAGTLAESNTGGTNQFADVDLSGGTINGSITDVTNITGNLTMPNGNGTIGRTTLTVSGTTTVGTGRTLTFNNDLGIKTFVGAVTVSGTGAWTSTTIATAGNLIFRGGIDVTSSSGSLAAAVATFNTNNQSITGAGPLTFGGAVAITGAITITNTNTNGVTFNSTVSGSVAGSTWKNGANGITLYQPAVTTQPMTTGALDVSASGNFFYYSSAGVQNIKVPVSSYYNLYLTGGSSAIKSLQGATTVGGSFVLAASTNFDPAANNFTVSGTSTIAGTFADANATGTSSLQDVDLSGGTIDGSATGVVNINGNLTMPSGNGTIGKVALTITGTTTVATARSLTFNANSDTGVKIFTGGITINGTGTWTSTNVLTGSNLSIRGGIDVVASSGSFAAYAATFSTNSQFVTGAGPITFANAVSISGAIVVTNTNTNGITFNNTVDGTVAGSTWKNGTNGVTYYQPGAATQPMNTGVLDMSTAGNYFYYSRAAAQTIKIPASSYYHLYLTGGSSSVKTLQASTTVSGDLSVAASTSLDIATFGITVTGATTLNGTFTDASNLGTNTFTGLFTIGSTGSLSTSNNSPFVFEGGITNNGTFNQLGAGAISFNTNNQNLDGTATMSFGGAVTIAAGKTVTNKNTNTSGIALNAVLDGANATSTWKNDVNSTVYYQPAATTKPMNTGILDVSASGNNFYYSRASGTQTMKNPTGGYYNLIINGGGGLIKTLPGNTVVHGNLTIAANTSLDVDAAQNYSITVKGNWVNSGTFLARAGSVTFNGTTDQQVTSNSNSFYNLVIDNTASQVSLNDNLTVTHILNLNDGVVTTSSYRVIVSSTSASAITGYSSISFVNGNLRKNIASNTSTYAFPVGNGTSANNYFLAELVNNGLTGITYIDSKFKPLTNHNDSQLNVADGWDQGALTYTSVNTAGVWELEPNAAPSSGTYSVKLYIANVPGLTDNEFGPLKRPVGSTTGADWSTGGGRLNPNDAAGRTVASGYMKRNALSSFSEFGVGQGSGSGAGLPIELLSFNATESKNSVELTWATATEINNASFTVERSRDGYTFEEVQVVPGAGNSSMLQNYVSADINPYPGISYYRLKQTDFDGTFTYSDIVSIEYASTGESLTVSPNPVVGSLVTVGGGKEIFEDATSVEVTDMGGKQVFYESLNLSGSSRFTINLPDALSKGLYLMVVRSNEKAYRSRLMVE